MPDTTYPTFPPAGRSSVPGDDRIPAGVGTGRPHEPWLPPDAGEPTLSLPEPPARAEEPPAPPQQPPHAGPPAGPAAPGRARRGGGWRNLLATILVAALVAGGVSWYVVDATQPEASEPATAAEEAAQQQAPAAAPLPGDGSASTVAAVAERVLPTVARVDVDGPRGQGSGSAVIFSEEGYLITNNHVVEGAAQVQVTLPDGSPEEAEIVGTDPASDLAVLEVDLSSGSGAGQTDALPVPEFADGTPAIGETAIAIGSPFGLDSSVTAGIVSAVNRNVAVPGAPLVDMIQTDAAINPGNSGGALVNDSGQVIGINTAILSRSGANDGIGFAIPIATALSSAEQLVERGFVQHAQLGIRGQDVDPQIAEMYGLPVSEGAVVADVEPGSAAEEAGLERGDIVTEFDGEPVTSMTELATLVRTHSPGDEVELTVVRGSGEETLRVTLGASESGGSPQG